jgi:hypothetical protein
VSTSIDNVLLCRYKQGMSMNWKSSIDHYVADDSWPIVNCYIQNAVDIVALHSQI